MAGLAVTISPKSKSPLDAVVMLPVPGDTPVPSAATETSRELEVATPEYSRMAKRIVPRIVSDTVMVLAPPTMFSAQKMPRVSASTVTLK